MNDDGGFTNKFTAKSKMCLVFIILCEQISKVRNIKILRLRFLTRSADYSGGPTKVHMHTLCKGGRNFVTKCDLRVTHATKTEVDHYYEITDTERKNSTGTLIMHDTSCLAYAKAIPSLHVQKSGIQKI